MRVTSEFWVSALVKRVFGLGGFAAVLKRGAAEAGAIFLILRGRFGTASLFGPAPQAIYGETSPDDRLFTQVLEAAEEAAIMDKLDRESRFDPDIWIVEIEWDQPVEPPLFAVRSS